MILEAIFARYPASYQGFYVDVGAHHPRRFSNSYHFYENGWRGICIDPVPGGSRLFAKNRSRDIFLDIGVGECEEELTYYIFEDPAYNTFSEELLKDIPYEPIEKRIVRILPLSKIFDENLPGGVIIDFLSIDAEGFDLQILRSNDWQRYRPHAVIIEEMSVNSLNDIAGLEANIIMNQNNYEVISWVPSGLIYADTNFRGYGGGSYLNYEKDRV